MLQKYINYLMNLAEYKKWETWVIVAKIPWYQWFYSQWEDLKEAEENLKDAIQWVINIKLSNNDKKITKDMEKVLYSQKQKFRSKFQLEYA